MGAVKSFLCGEPPSEKPGMLYSKVRGELQPFDLLLFNGGDFISDFISYVQAKNLPDKTGGLVKPGAFSHVGMVVTSDILDHPLVKPGTVYVFESTMSGKLGNGIDNIEGRAFFGVQLRNFDELMPAYDKPNDTSIAFAHLMYNPWIHASPEERVRIKARFTDLFDRLNGTPYNANPYSLLAAIFPCLRKERKKIEDLFGTKKWLFCSELVATVYKEFGIFPRDINPENIVPMDFVGDDENTHNAPTVIYIPPAYITTQLHK